MPAASVPRVTSDIALPRGRFDRARRAVEAGNQVRAERKPGIGAIAKRSRRHLQDPTVAGSAASREIGSVLIPGTKPARPATRHIHPGDHRVFAANMADEIDSAVDEHPPEVRMLALMEQIDARLDPNFSTVLDQIGELIICQAVEDAQRAKIIDTHQIVAR